KSQPKRADEHRDRFKFGMTLISLALIRHDLEAKTREDQQAGNGDAENGDDEDGKSKRRDIHETGADVTSALAPFVLPLVDSLWEIRGTVEPLSKSAGEAA